MTQPSRPSSATKPRLKIPNGRYRFSSWRSRGSTVTITGILFMGLLLFLLSMRVPPKIAKESAAGTIHERAARIRGQIEANPNSNAKPNIILQEKLGKITSRAAIPAISKAQLDNLPLFAAPTTPTEFQPSTISDERAWDKWAPTPMVGSYRYVPEGVTAASGAGILHLPVLDLQTFYKGKPPRLHLSDSAFRTNRSLSIPSNECVVLTRKGNKFSQTGVAANQDRVGILSYSFDDNEAQADWWMGLFDGHGEWGHVVSQFALYEFPKRLQSFREQLTTGSSETVLKEGLQKIFIGIHQDLPRFAGAGSTGVSIWKRGSQLIVSNVGDSKAFVVQVRRPPAGSGMSPNTVSVVYETKPHKPDDPLERARIEKVGGKIQPAPAPGFSARVVIPIGDPPVDAMGLAMSRSLGDHDGEAVGVVAEPTTDIVDLTKLSSEANVDYLVILASDGLVDRVSEQEIAQRMSETTLLGGADRALEVGEDLILKSSQLWSSDLMGGGYRDDISLAVHRLRLPKL